MKTKKKPAPGISPAGVDLAGKTVILHQSFFKKGLKAEDHPFKCRGGFGCDPQAAGRKVFGIFLSDGEECHIDRSDVAYIIDEGTGKDATT